jgi:hypothetical protein
MEQDENISSTNQEQDQNVISDYYQGYQQLELQSAETQIKKARNAIIAIAILIIVGNLIVMATDNSFTSVAIIIMLGIAAIFTGLAFLTKKQPLTAIIIALVLFLGLWVSDVVIAGPENIYKGIVVRVIILYFLIKGIKHAREAERLRKEMISSGK